MEHGWIMTFHSVGNFIIPTDELIFFRGVGIPPTRVGLYLIGLSWRLVCPKRTFWLSNVGKRLLCLCLGIPILGHVNGNNVWYLGVPNFEIHMPRESRAPTDWDILKWHWNRPANFGGCAWSYFSRTTHAQFKNKKDKWVDGHRELYYWHIGTIITRHEFQESSQVPQTKKRRLPCRCIDSFTMLPVQGVRRQTDHDRTQQQSELQEAWSVGIRKHVARTPSFLALRAPAMSRPRPNLQMLWDARGECCRNGHSKRNGANWWTFSASGTVLFPDGKRHAWLVILLAWPVGPQLLQHCHHAQKSWQWPNLKS